MLQLANNIVVNRDNISEGDWHKFKCAIPPINKNDSYISLNNYVSSCGFIAFLV